MASYDVASGGRASHENALGASAEDTVFFEDEFQSVEVISHNGTAAIYFTLDGTAATVKGGTCYVIPAAVGSQKLKPPIVSSGVKVRLISSGTPTYSVVCE